jgi:hypothetical protein
MRGLWLALATVCALANTPLVLSELIGRLPPSGGISGATNPRSSGCAKHVGGNRQTDDGTRS